MEKNRGVIRELLKFEYELGHSAKEAVKNINRAKGNGTVSYTNAKVWFSKFRNNEMDISDKKRSGRPQEVGRVAVVNARSPDKRPDRTFGQRKRCFACGGTGVGPYFGSFWSKGGPLTRTSTVNNPKTPAVPFEIVESL
jgi:hypothetical protein